MYNQEDFYYMVKRIYEQKTGKQFNTNDNLKIQPTEEYIKWLENELNKAWSALEDNGLKK
jgi:hypothetical protein